MKNLNKVRTSRGYFLEFKDEEQMWKFLFLYKDLLVPYSEQTIREAKSFEDRHKDELFLYHKRLGNYQWLRFGIDLRMWSDNDEEIIVKVLMRPEDFNNIKGMFKKEVLRRGTSKYVLQRMGL